MRSKDIDVMNSQNLSQLVVSTLDDNKARDIVCLDVRGLSNVADFMVVTTATSSRHSKALADKVADAVRASGNRVFGMEGEQSGEWVLLDVGDVLVHVMLEETRRLYQLEKLWDIKSLGATAKA
jgi:ribosome-associated protein